jgi:hypothetical protein
MNDKLLFQENYDTHQSIINSIFYFTKSIFSAAEINSFTANYLIDFIKILCFK